MKIKIIVSLLVFLGSYTAWACMNDEMGVGGEEKIFFKSYHPIPIGLNLKDYKKRFEYERDAELDEYKQRQNIGAHNNYGAALIYLGEYEKAKAVFQEIEQKTPKQYNTAANLGTLYELMGQNDSALIWIQKAIEIDPKSHENSEWLHVNILKAKINPKKYLNTDSLIGTNFGKDAKPFCLLTVAKVDSLREALYFQLSERMSFIQPKDEIVALLLFELGNLVFTQYESSNFKSQGKDVNILYHQAKQYGFKNKSLLEKRLSYLMKWRFHDTLSKKEALAQMEKEIIDFETDLEKNHISQMEHIDKYHSKPYERDTSTHYNTNTYTEEDAQKHEASNNTKTLWLVFGSVLAFIALIIYVNIKNKDK